MTPKDPTELLFDKHDALVKDLGQMRERHAVSMSRIDRLESDFQQLQAESAERHGQIIATLSDVRRSIAELGGQQQYNQGAKDQRRFLVPALVSIIGLMVTGVGAYVGIVKMMGA